MRGSTITFAFILLVCTSTHAMAQQAPDTVDAEKDEPLAEKVYDPTASLRRCSVLG